MVIAFMINNVAVISMLIRLFFHFPWITERTLKPKTFLKYGMKIMQHPLETNDADALIT